MNSAAVAFLVCLLVFYTQGQPTNRSIKCKCLNGYVGKIKPQDIKAGPVTHEPSIFCPRTEIIITTTENREKCVNPRSPLGKLILKNKNKYQKNATVNTTAASSSTDTTAASSSTRHHTTSRL
uniref:CXC-like chemokine n=1 Tax=Miichthys miiuy TaxID=240162 RepID=G3EXI3_MIIMI|nr:CXC-like chemokine [Miichthys miiuy]AEM75120.1 CXC-like chemokine [Miichthys miiuy]